MKNRTTILGICMIVMFLVAALLVYLGIAATKKGTAQGYGEAQADLLLAIFSMQVVRFAQAAIYRRIAEK